MLTIRLSDLDRLHALLIELSTVYYLHTLTEFDSCAALIPSEEIRTGRENANAYLWDRTGEILTQLQNILLRPDFTRRSEDPTAP